PGQSLCRQLLRLQHLGSGESYFFRCRARREAGRTLAHAGDRAAVLDLGLKVWLRVHRANAETGTGLVREATTIPPRHDSVQRSRRCTCEAAHVGGGIGRAWFASRYRSTRAETPMTPNNPNRAAAEVTIRLR